MTGDGCPDRANISWSAVWNPSTLLWTVSWAANGAGYYNNNYVTIFSGTVTVKDANGNTLQTKSMAAQIPYARKDVELLTGSFTVGVDSVGDQSLQFSAVFRIGYNSATGESTGSQTFALDTVPLASYFTSAPAGVTVTGSGGTSSVSITRYNNSYTHDVTWMFGSHSHTETGVATSKSYTIPASWLDAIPNSMTGTATITLVTKYNGVQIGQPVTAQITITANVPPTYSGITYTYKGAAYSAGITGALIAGYSNMRIAVSGASAKNGASIARYEFYKGSSLLASVNSSATLYNYDTPLFTAAETTTFKVRITDSRGKTVEATSGSYTIKAYALPALSNVSVYRSNSSGTATNDGTYIRILATATATPAENSITALTYATKAATDAYYGAETNLTSGTPTIAPGFSNTTSYNVRITATDTLGNSVYRYYTVPTQTFTMDFKAGGKGVAFGKAAETDNLLDSAWGIRSADYIEADNGMVCKTSTAYGNLNFQKTTDASRGLSVSTVTWSDSNQMYFNIFHRANDANNSYVDQYWLPESEKDSSNHSYNILTTKGAGELSGLTSPHTINASKIYAIPIGNYCRIVEVNAVITLTSAVSNGSRILEGIPAPLTGAGWWFKPLHGSNTSGTGYELKYGASSGETYGNVQSAQSIASGTQFRIHFVYFAQI